ncbi:hypothetical protein SAMN05660860_02347 [Geoalkalibacter ferrihydriticus]|uniref:Uncharacterized protein n=1 Tax=Geoalkalibacter ferrihydriticus TaxID=392333 RepID=A0A1G9SEW9_9BACT|nr:hypothetical protein SAMN05660860_02347 [Geoalkalibacter ferrihydriticus]
MLESYITEQFNKDFFKTFPVFGSNFVRINKNVLFIKPSKQIIKIWLFFTEEPCM